MIKVSGLSLPYTAGVDRLRALAARQAGQSEAELGDMRILKKSLDARRKNDIRYTYTVGFGAPDAPDYALPDNRRSSSLRPVVVGLGPAGLFAAWALAKAGLRPIVIERGQPVEQRTQDVEQFWRGGDLNPESNVQFGEGGAGTFSDGKLTTGTKNPRHSLILDTFVRHGAAEEIRYLQKPHIGTDVLRQVVVGLRQELVALGCDIRFGTRLEGLELRHGALSGVKLSTGETVESDACVLALGHSARDTFAMLHDAGVSMEQKSFAIGVRVEHPQKLISRSQFGDAWQALPAADYKLVAHAPNGRSAFTFCVCPGGEIVAAASEPGHLVTNGMSHFARDGRYINGGLLVGVGPADFDGNHPLAGVAFQRQWEAAAFQFGGGNYHAPAQSVAGLMAGVPFALPRPSSYRPQVVSADLQQVLPAYITDTLRFALHDFDRKIKGFAADDTLLVGVETRSSSPVRLLRGEDFQSLSTPGLYPAGEGAGYAGGIMSAAADGLMAAEHILQR